MKKLQKLKLNEMQDYNAINYGEQMMLKGGGDDPNTWKSWDDIPHGTQIYAVNDATYVDTGSKTWMLAEGSGGSGTRFVSPTAGTLSQAGSGVQKMTLREAHDKAVEECPTITDSPYNSLMQTVIDVVSWFQRRDTTNN